MHLSLFLGYLLLMLGDDSVSTMPRSLISIADLTSGELKKLVQNAIQYKKLIRSGDFNSGFPLKGQVISMLFNKRSTRTRVSTESASAYLGAQSMFLGKDDIQLGVNESLYDTTKIISSMTSAIVARVGPHQDILDLAEHSRVPVINALSDKFHPLQAIADIMTLTEVFEKLEGLKIAWVGDANNVLYDLALASVKLGINVAVATPKEHAVSDSFKKLFTDNNCSGASLSYTNDPLEAVRDADVIVTDTWVSMGQESEKAERLKQFSGFQVSSEMAVKAGAKPDWKFMHCLPRKPEEVTDEVFYSDRSLVFEEGENRLYAAIAVLDAFVVNKGTI